MSLKIDPGIKGQLWSKVSDFEDYPPKSEAVALTFDIDWVCDEILEDCIELVEKTGAPATWFVTHDTRLLERLRANKQFELGIHPNFNALLDGGSGHAEEILDKILEIVPEAVSVRSHSLVNSSRLVELFHKKGLLFECNDFIPAQSKIILKPWAVWNGMVKIPHFWEDDAECLYNSALTIEELLSVNGIKVFDFHPIHVYLNTADLALYDSTRRLHTKPSELIQHRCDGVGTRSLLLDLLCAFNDNGFILSKGDNPK
ncbi:hypothetical protein N9M31_07685 [Alphaproteobacteria bacterium]|nr:hypothetical protein [Alphaproteobacteria bacterium]